MNLLLSQLRSRLQKLSLRGSNLGFTLVELLIVMAIISVLAAVIITSAILPAQKHARDTKRKSDLEFIRTGIETYRADCNTYPILTGDLPASLKGDDSTASCVSSNVYISTTPTDPTPTKSNYYYSSSGTTYVICAALEVPPTTPGNTNGCGSCGPGNLVCNYRVTNP